MKVATIIRAWDRIREGLTRTIEKFSDDDLNYVAFENAYSVRQIILHIAHEEHGEIQYGLTRKLDAFPAPFRDDAYPSAGSVKSLLGEVHGETIRYLESLEDHELGSDFEAQWGETRPLIDFIVHVIEHEAHHRGELSLILGILGREGLDA